MFGLVWVQSVHEGRIYTLKLFCDKDYPDKPPTVRFHSRINMTHVNQETGLVSPSLNLAHLNLWQQKALCIGHCVSRHWTKNPTAVVWRLNLIVNVVGVVYIKDLAPIFCTASHIWMSCHYVATQAWIVWISGNEGADFASANAGWSEVFSTACTVAPLIHYGGHLGGAQERDGKSPQSQTTTAPRREHILTSTLRLTHRFNRRSHSWIQLFSGWNSIYCFSIGIVKCPWHLDVGLMCMFWLAKVQSFYISSGLSYKLGYLVLKQWFLCKSGVLRALCCHTPIGKGMCRNMSSRQ